MTFQVNENDHQPLSSLISGNYFKFTIIILLEIHVISVTLPSNPTLSKISVYKNVTSLQGLLMKQMGDKYKSLRIQCHEGLKANLG